MREHIENTPIEETIEIIENPLTGEQEKRTRLTLSTRFITTSVLTEEAEKMGDIKEYTIKLMRRKLEEHLNELIVNQLYEDKTLGQISINLGAQEPLLLTHPRHLADILRDGFHVFHVDVQSSPTSTRIEE